MKITYSNPEQLSPATMEQLRLWAERDAQPAQLFEPEIPFSNPLRLAFSELAAKLLPIDGQIVTAVPLPEDIDAIDSLDTAKKGLAALQGLLADAEQASDEQTARMLTVQAELTRVTAERDAIHVKLTEALKADKRQRLPDERHSETRTFRIPRPDHAEGEFQLYVTVGLFPDGRPGEVFFTTDKEGSFARSALDAAATALSMALQYGAPLAPILEKWRGMSFPPAGVTGDPKYPIVASVLDYFARWALDTFCKEG